MKKKIILGVVAVLVIIAAVFGVLYLTTDLFKTPEQLFYKHLADSSSILGETSYEEFMAELKAELDGSMEVAGEVTVNITSNDASTQEVAAVLEKGKITYNVKTVGSEQKMQSDITLNYNENDVVTLNVLQNKDQYGIKIEEAYDKYISVENNNLKALFQKLGVDTTDIPDRIEMVDYYELLNIDNETLKHIETTYSDVLTQNIPEECYSVEENVTVNHRAGNITTNAYKLTLTEEQVKTVLVKVFETLKSDDKTLDLIVNKCNATVEPYKDMGEVDTLTKEELVEAIEEELASLNEMEATSNKALEIVVYSAKDNKARVEIVAEEAGDQVLKMEIDMMKSENDKNLAISCSDEDATVQMIMSYNDTKEDVVVAVESEGTLIEVVVKQEIKATENVSVEDFNSNNSVKLNDMSQTEMTELVQVIYTNVMKVLPEKMQLLGIDASTLESVV